MHDLHQQKSRLVNDLAAGRIDRVTYERKMEQLQAVDNGLPQLPPGSTSVPAMPSQPTAQSERGSKSRRAGAIGPGTIISGRFVLESQLGRGGMGEVWKAWEKAGKRRLVIKILPPELQGNPTEVQRIEEMFRRVEGLQHEHICPTLLIDDDPSSVGCYIVMKFITGMTLREYWKQTVKKHLFFPWKDVGATLRPIAAALDYAHSRKVVHRDVKTENIMVTADGRNPQLVDFGLAAEIRDSHARVSKVRMEGAGTYPYMAPEQWKGRLQEGATDQYALAVVAYELLTSGGFPFFDADPAKLRKLVLTQGVPAIDTLPTGANSALRRALAKQADKRFSNCVKFVEALAASLDTAEATVPPPLTNTAAIASTGTTTRDARLRSSTSSAAPHSSQAIPTSAPPRIRRSWIPRWNFQQIVGPLKSAGRWLIGGPTGWITLAVGGGLLLLLMAIALAMIFGSGGGNFDH